MDPVYSSDWFSGNLANMATVKDFLVRHKPSYEPLHILEVGSYEGRSTRWFLENLVQGHFASLQSTITCVDTWKGSEEAAHDYIKSGVESDDVLWKRFSHNLSPFASHVIAYRGFSRNELHRIYVDCLQTNKRFDFIYIDGSHKRLNCLEDILLSFPLLRMGGILLVDDYLWGSAKEEDDQCPRGAVHMFERLYKDYIQLIFVNYQIGFVKIKDL